MISAPKHHQTTTVACISLSSVIQFDKFFHLMALYENYLICIFMNINENFKNKGKPIELKNATVPTYTKILISQQQLILQNFTWYQINF